MSQKEVHTSYYAIDPRKVRDLVEKSGRNRPCDAKCGKSEGFLGDRPEEAVAVSYLRSTCVQAKGLRAIDEGDEFAGVPRYNGNLFKYDLLIDDPRFKLDAEKWPRILREFGEYDYQHEVTVDVLGRIFERSITDIEHLKASGLEKYPEALAKKPKTGKRKDLGIYYTSAYIVEYLVSAALDPQKEERRQHLIEELGSEAVHSNPPSAAFSRAMLAWIDSLRVCDLACGSGAFLTAVYNWIEDTRLDVLTDLQRAEPDAS